MITSIPFKKQKVETFFGEAKQFYVFIQYFIYLLYNNFYRRSDSNLVIFSQIDCFLSSCESSSTEMWKNSVEKFLFTILFRRRIRNVAKIWKKSEKIKFTWQKSIKNQIDVFLFFFTLRAKFCRKFFYKLMFLFFIWKLFVFQNGCFGDFGDTCTTYRK